MDKHFSNSIFLNELFKSRDRADNKSNNKTRKRTRDEYYNELDDMMKDVLYKLDNNNLLPTFRSLLLSDFYILLATNQYNEYYDDVCKVVVEFRQLMHKIDTMFGRHQFDSLYMLITNDLFMLLHNSQQLILLFHLSCH